MMSGGCGVYNCCHRSRGVTASALFGIQKALPLHQAVEVDFTPQKTGKIRYACAMDMIAGVIVVE